MVLLVLVDQARVQESKFYVMYSWVPYRGRRVHRHARHADRTGRHCRLEVCSALIREQNKLRGIFDFVRINQSFRMKFKSMKRRRVTRAGSIQVLRWPGEHLLLRG